MGGGKGRGISEGKGGAGEGTCRQASPGRRWEGERLGNGDHWQNNVFGSFTPLSFILFMKTSSKQLAVSKIKVHLLEFLAISDAGLALALFHSLFAHLLAYLAKGINRQLNAHLRVGFSNTLLQALS